MRTHYSTIICFFALLVMITGSAVQALGGILVLDYSETTATDSPFVEAGGSVTSGGITSLLRTSTPLGGSAFNVGIVSRGNYLATGSGIYSGYLYSSVGGIVSNYYSNSSDASISGTGRGTSPMGSGSFVRRDPRNPSGFQRFSGGVVPIFGSVQAGDTIRLVTILQNAQNSLDSGTSYAFAKIVLSDNGFPGQTPANAIASDPVAPGDLIYVPPGRENTQVEEQAFVANETTGAYLTAVTNDVGVENPIYIGNTEASNSAATASLFAPSLATSEVVDAYLYESFGLNFASVVLPESIGGIDTFGIRFGDDADSLIYTNSITAGSPFDFTAYDPNGVSAFESFGFGPLGFDLDSPSPFVLGLTFTEAGFVTVLESTSSSATAVPEPSTLALLAMGTLGLIGYRRRSSLSGDQSRN